MLHQKATNSLIIIQNGVVCICVLSKITVILKIYHVCLKVKINYYGDKMCLQF